MKNPDLFAKRFLAVCLGISAILLSGSLFLLSLRNVTPAIADPLFKKDLPKGLTADRLNRFAHVHSVLQADTTDTDIQAIQAFGLGMRDGIIYFGILYNNNTVGLHKTEYDSGDIIHW